MTPGQLVAGNNNGLTRWKAQYGLIMPFGRIQVFFVDKVVSQKQIGLGRVRAVFVFGDNCPVMFNHLIELAQFSEFMGHEEMNLVAILELWEVV